MKPCPVCATRWVDQACSSTGIRLPDAVRRQLIAGLLARRHLILSGPSGLGKASLARALALCMVQGRASHVRSIQGHPWWAANTHDVAHFVMMQTDYSLWRLIDFVESIVMKQESSSPSYTLDAGQEYVAFVEQMSPVEIELYFDRFLGWLTVRKPTRTSLVPLRLIGTYNADSPLQLDGHVQRLAALVHLDWTAWSEHDENGEKYLVVR